MSGPTPIPRLRAVALAGALVPMAVTLAAFATSQHRAHRRLMMAERAQSASELAGIVDGSLEGAMLAREPAAFRGAVERLGSEPGVHRLLVLNRQGEVRAATDAGSVGEILTRADAVAAACADRAVAAGAPVSDLASTASGRVLRDCRPVQNKPACHGCHLANKEYNGVLVTEVPLAELDAHLAEDLRNTALAALAALAAGGVVASLLVGRGGLVEEVEQRTRELERVNVALREQEASRKRLLRQLISAQEDERRRVARHLHDELAQSLTGLIMTMDAADPPPAGSAGDRVRSQLGRTRALASQALTQTRQLILDLRPSILDDLGLEPALRWAVNAHLVPSGVAVSFRSHGQPCRLGTEVETAAYRIVQEALVNVARHARARHVAVQVEWEDDRVTLSVEDDGVGFRAAGARAHLGQGLGFLGMRERADMIGAVLEIESRPGSGTEVHLVVPTARAAP